MTTPTVGGAHRTGAAGQRDRGSSHDHPVVGREEQRVRLGVQDVAAAAEASTRAQVVLEELHLLDALDNLRSSSDLKEILGLDFVIVYLDVKYTEHEAYQQVISAWEREHLLLNV